VVLKFEVQRRSFLSYKDFLIANFISAYFHNALQTTTGTDPSCNVIMCTDFIRIWRVK